jgi:hypothetical protein
MAAVAIDLPADTFSGLGEIERVRPSNAQRGD